MREIEATFTRAVELHQHGEVQQAEALYRDVLSIMPGHDQALHLLGITVIQSGRREEGRGLIEQSLNFNPRNAEALSNLGNCHRDVGDFEQALNHYDRALAVRPQMSAALINRARTLRALGRPQEAAASYESALDVIPNHAELRCQLGEVLLHLKQTAEARKQFDLALKIDPKNAAAMNGRGNVFEALGQPAQALHCYQAALNLQPDNVGILCNLSTAMLALGRPLEALKAADRALTLAPRFAHGHNARGMALLPLRRLEEAESHFEQAAAEPGFLKAQANHAGILSIKNRDERAAEAYDRLLAAAPEWPRARGFRLNSHLRCCEWSQYDRDVAEITAGVESGQMMDHPLNFLSVCDSPALQRKCAADYSADQVIALNPAGSRVPQRGARIRLGYLSSDLREHAVSYLLAGVFEQHDRGQFEVIALCTAPTGDSPMSTRLRLAFDRFVDLSDVNDEDGVHLIQDLEIDILIDLNGYTLGMRPALFRHRLAPVQVNYLGYPGTLGGAWMDYIIADPYVIPPGREVNFAEKVAFLPDCFQANDNQRELQPPPSRRHINLPPDALVLASFNNSHKFNPPMFDIWMRALREHEATVLWLGAPQPVVQNNLLREAGKRGVAAHRLLFSPRVPYRDHLARLQSADLCLDTLPFSAGATASDALFAGVPLLTCAGRSFSARMAASLLNTLGLHELIAADLDDYALRLLGFLNDPAQLRSLRDRLARRKLESPLFDTPRFTGHLESAYRIMHERACEALAPQTFYIR